MNVKFWNTTVDGQVLRGEVQLVDGELVVADGADCREMIEVLVGTEGIPDLETAIRETPTKYSGGYLRAELVGG